MADNPISPKDFGASFKGFMAQMARQDPGQEPFFRQRLREHFGADPSKFAIVAEKISEANHPNLHLAVEAYVTATGRTVDVVGVSAEAPAFMGTSLAQLVSSGGGGMHGTAPSEGPVTYINVALDGDRVLACTQLGLYLVRDGDSRLAIFVVRTERGTKGKRQRAEIHGAPPPTAPPATPPPAATTPALAPAVVGNGGHATST